MKNLIYFSFTLLIGFLIGYNYKTINKQKNNKFIVNERTLISEIEKIETIPSYIKTDLENEGFNTSELNITTWKDFLLKRKNNNFEEFIKLVDSNNLMHQLIKKGSKEHISKLLKLGYDINSNYKGMTPLLMAFKIYKDLDFINFLINNGANLYINNDHPRAYDALNFALGNTRNGFNFKEELVDYLLENGFEFKKKHFLSLFKIKDNNKKNFYLKEYINSMTMNEIYSKESNTSYLEYFINRQVDDEIITYLLDTKIDFSTLKVNDKALLFGISKNKHISFNNFTKLINKIKLNVNQTTLSNKTPLMITVENADYEKIKYLLELGADISIKTIDGKDVYTYLNNLIISTKKKEEIKSLLDSFNLEQKRNL